MANLYRPTIIRYVDADGRQVTKGTPGARHKRMKSKTWWGKYRGADGKPKCVSLDEDRETAETMLAGFIQDVRDEKAGIPKPQKRYKAHGERLLVCPVCNSTGTFREAGKAQECECDGEHLTGFRQHLSAKGNVSDHVKLTISRIRTVFDKCKFEQIGDLSAGRVSSFLAELRKSNLSIASSNAYLVAVKSFGNWLMKDRRNADVQR